MRADLTGSPDPSDELWPVLFELAERQPVGWSIVGAQMVMLHAIHHGIRRPLITRDLDIVVDIRAVRPRTIAEQLTSMGFALAPMSTDGIGHRFVRGPVTIDLLSIDHQGRTDLTTIPPARTIPIPGGRRAFDRSTMIEVVSTTGEMGIVPLPDWLGAVLLKARAALAVSAERAKHVQDLALLLGLPTDVVRWSTELAGWDRRHLRRGGALIDGSAWRAVASSVDVAAGRTALAILTREVR